MPTIGKKIKMSTIHSNTKFTSLENPLSYAKAVKNGNVSIKVISPFHSNMYPTKTPTITVKSTETENFIVITPVYNEKIPLTNICTQVVKISFKLKNAVLVDGCATLNISVDLKALPDTTPGMLGEPFRKTKIIVQSTDA